MTQFETHMGIAWRMDGGSRDSRDRSGTSQNWAWTEQDPEVSWASHMTWWPGTSRRHLLCQHLFLSLWSGCLIREKPLTASWWKDQTLAGSRLSQHHRTCQTEMDPNCTAAALGRGHETTSEENSPQGKTTGSTSNHLVYMEPEVAWG